ncbi:MAG TPA: hypothetical protein VGL77_03990 [Armatimonadota bacterium]|jgi:hypothetical protein
MNLTMAKKALVERIAAYVAMLPAYPMVDESERVPLVFTQVPPSDNDGVDHIPCVIVRLGGWQQQGDVRRADAAVGVMLTNPDQDQLFADVEGILDGIAANLIANPWLDHGRYHLVGEPWNVVVGESADTLLNGMIEFKVELPAILETVAPDGQALSEIC